jgi:hypothetical protein
MKITGNEPIVGTKNKMLYNSFDGLTIRQYYAGLAMQAYVSTYNNDAEPDSSYAANFAVEMADRLIKKLNESL